MPQVAVALLGLFSQSLEELGRISTVVFAGHLAKVAEDLKKLAGKITDESGGSGEHVSANSVFYRETAAATTSVKIARASVGSSKSKQRASSVPLKLATRVLLVLENDVYGR